MGLIPLLDGEAVGPGVGDEGGANFTVVDVITPDLRNGVHRV